MGEASYIENRQNVLAVGAPQSVSEHARVDPQNEREHRDPG